MIICLTVAIFSAKGWVVAGDKNEIAEHNLCLALPTSSPSLLAVQSASHVDHPLRPNPAVVNLLCVAPETQIRDLTPAVEKELEFVVRDPQHSQMLCFSDVKWFLSAVHFSVIHLGVCVSTYTQIYIYIYIYGSVCAYTRAIIQLRYFWLTITTIYILYFYIYYIYSQPYLCNIGGTELSKTWRSSQFWWQRPCGAVFSLTLKLYTSLTMSRHGWLT